MKLLVFSLGNGNVINWDKEQFCGKNFPKYYMNFWLSEAKLTFSSLQIILNYIISLSVKSG